MIGSITGATSAAMFGGFGFVAIIIFPIISAISGFIGGAIGAALYNLVASKIGGIEMELVPAQPVVAPAPSTITPTAVKFCASCGAKIPASTKFCGTCGAAQGAN